MRFWEENAMQENAKKCKKYICKKCVYSQISRGKENAKSAFAYFPCPALTCYLHLENYM